MTAPRTRGTLAEAFVGYLETKREDRATLASLRRGLGKQPGEAIEAYKHVLRFNPPERDEDAFCLVASLFALHPQSWRAGDEEGRSRNFGSSFAWLRREVDGEGVERRFVALLNADREDLPDNLRHAVSLLRSKSVPVDWVQLIRDLSGWDRENRPVQRSWARAFWGGAPPTGATSVDVPAPTSSSEDEIENAIEEEA